jgi:hypothetical protein
MFKLDDGAMRVQEAYANLYNEITQPDKVFVSTQYFRRQWVPRLGHTLAWLILALRQRCYWNKRTGEERDWCVVTQEELAQEIGVELRTVRRLLQAEHASKFIVEMRGRYQYDNRLGKRVREDTLYRVRMDDPLVPEDEERLRQRLAAELAGLDVDPKTGQVDMLKLLDRPLEDATVSPNARSNGNHVEDILPGSSPLPQGNPSGESPDLEDKMSGRSDHLADKMSARSPDLEDKMSGRSGHLPDILSGESPSPTGQNVRYKDISTTNKVLVIPEVQQQQQYTPAAKPVVAVGHLKDLQLGLEEVLVPDENGPPSADLANGHEGSQESFVVQPLAEVVKQDIRAAGRYQPPLESRSEIYYSVAHALDEGGDEWTDEEQAKIRLRQQLERDLGETWNRLGGFSLEESLRRFFSAELVTRFLAGASEAERSRIEGWVSYARAATTLRNPGGFLRSKIESGESPPNPNGR